MDAGTLALAAAISASDAQAAANAVPEPAPFKLDVSADFWLPRLEGHFTDNGADVDVRAVDVHDSTPSFGGTLGFRSDRIAFSVRGFAFSTTGATDASEAFTLGGITVNQGDAFHSSFSWWGFGGELLYDFYRPNAERPMMWSDAREGWKAPANNTDFSVFTTVSADIQSMARDIVDTTTSDSTTANEAFLTLELGIGVRVGFDTRESFPLVRRMEICGKAQAGLAMPMGSGDSSMGTASHIEADATAWFSPQCAAYFGYRLIGLSADAEELSLTGSLQGLRAGIKLEF